MPPPQKEHEWLKQFVGEWDTEAEVLMEPGKPPVKMKGTESARLVGGFWLISELKGECFGVPMTGIMTVGYDVQKKKYVGTFICSASDWLCKYEGTVKGQVLTLDTEGPSFAGDGTTVRYQDVITLVDANTRTLHSQTLGQDGQWKRFMTATYKRQ